MKYKPGMLFKMVGVSCSHPDDIWMLLRPCRRWASYKDAWDQVNLRTGEYGWDYGEQYITRYVQVWSEYDDTKSR